MNMARRHYYGVDKLGGKYPSSVWAEFPQVTIFRPLLEVRKSDLQDLCRNEGVKWIKDPSTNYLLHNIRKVLQENEELVPGIAGLVKTCQETRRHLKHQGIVVNTVKQKLTVENFSKAKLPLHCKNIPWN